MSEFIEILSRNNSIKSCIEIGKQNNWKHYPNFADVIYLQQQLEAERAKVKLLEEKPDKYWADKLSFMGDVMRELQQQLVDLTRERDEREEYGDRAVRTSKHLEKQLAARDELIDRAKEIMDEVGVHNNQWLADAKRAKGEK